jgi:hypothetical protein
MECENTGISVQFLRYSTRQIAHWRMSDAEKADELHET